MALSQHEKASGLAPVELTAYVKELPLNPIDKVLKTDLRKQDGQPQHDMAVGAAVGAARRLGL